MAEAYKHHFYGHVEKEITRYLGLLLIDPARFLDYTREYCGRVMSRLAWDDATQGRLNGESADQTLHCMSVSGPLTNTMTPLWHLPSFVNPWYNFEIKREREQRAWWLNNFRLAKDRMRRGELPNDTWAYRYFEQIKREGNESLDQEEEQEVFASCMIGFLNLVGVVTISGPLKFFLMAMALHLEWQKKAQAEIDRVCGDRMPTMQDFADLPTVRACLKETVRWRSGVPLGEFVTRHVCCCLAELITVGQASRTKPSATTNTAASRSRRERSSSHANGKPSPLDHKHTDVPI
jgi:hypothetical protein